MLPFDFSLPTRIVFGPDQLDRLGELAAELGARRALVCSDAGIIAAGHTRRGVEALQKSGVESRVFDAVVENPTDATVAQGVLLAQDWRPDLIVGLGGGSSMDCAKGINFVYTNGGRMQDYWGIGKTTQPMLPMIAVPTTSGTGSEAQSFALISDAQTHVKMACGDKKAAFRIALLDPKLTVTMPRAVTALTGIDAISHALETFVTKKRNSLSLAWSAQAWRMLAPNFSRVLQAPDDLEARGAMQLGACFAGLAIENSMLGATHALANPLTAHFGIPHGQAIALMLPAVIRFNGEQFARWYRDLLEYTSGFPGLPEPISGSEGLADFVTNLAHQAGLATQLSACGVPQETLPTLAADAAKQWTGGFNPREVDAPQLLQLYEQAY